MMTPNALQRTAASRRGCKGRVSWPPSLSSWVVSLHHAMSSIHTPQEKKRLAYQRDHSNRNAESNKAWRKAKPRKTPDDDAGRGNAREQPELVQRQGICQQDEISTLDRHSRGGAGNDRQVLARVFPHRAHQPIAAIVPNFA